MPLTTFILSWRRRYFGHNLLLTYPKHLVLKASSVHVLKLPSAISTQLETFLWKISLNILSWVTCFLNKSSFISGSLLPRDCSEITDTRIQHNGTHTIYPFGVQTMPAYVYCEFDANGTAWTVCLFFTQLNGFGPLHWHRLSIYFDSEISHIRIF